MNLTSFLKNHLKQMQKCFVVENFDVNIRFEEIKSAMEITVDYEYLEADIVYGDKVKKLWEQNKIDQILKYLVHEITHILTGEVKIDKKNFCKTYHDERATEHISRLLYRLYIKEYYEEVSGVRKVS